jgi:diguanylate cyclase (GGDEF)-like protein
MLTPYHKHVAILLLLCYNNRNMARRTASVKCLGEGVIERCERTKDNAAPERVLGKKACMACIQGRMLELQDQAKHDTLTGLPNNRGLEEFFKKLKKGGKPFGLIFIDLENFKRINETNGHHGGDIALQFTAKHLQRVVRQDDDHGHTDTIVTRKGGDELLILVDLNPRREETASTMTEIERLESAANHIKYSYAGKREVTRYNMDVTPSQKLGLRIGMAVYEDGMSLEEFVTAADPKGHKANHEPTALMPGIQMMLHSLEEGM